MTAQTDSKLKTAWQLQGLYLDSCNCDWGCPCQFNARPTHGKCEGLFGIQIKDGNYGSTKIDGLNLVWIASYPRAIHEGHGKASMYIDNTATDEQQFFWLGQQLILMPNSSFSPPLDLESA